MYSKITLALFVLTGTLCAQTDANKGQIVGSVWDPKQAAIRGADVHIKSAATGATRDLKTGEDGQFRAIALDPGSYEVRVESSGLAPAVIPDVVVNVGSSRSLNVTLQIGTTVQTIEVTATLNADVPAPSKILDLTVIQNLPINGRRFTDFATMTPSVQVDPARGSISFAGQRGIYGNVMVDGTDYNNPFFGGMRGGERSGFVFTIPQSSIQEFQVITSGYAAEYGRSSGGILNAVSKSGSNQIHGEAFYQIRHKETALKTPFGFQNLETLQQFGGGAGGALKKDRLFWFAAAERQKSKLPRNVYFSTLVGLAPTPQQAEAFDFIKGLQTGFQTTNDATATTGRLDYQWNDGSRLTTRFNFSDANAINAITTGAALPALDNRALSGSGSEQDRTWTGIAQYTKILSPSMVNDFRFSSTVELRPRTSNSAVANVGSTVANFGARNFLPTTQDDERYQFNDGLSISRGSHTFKLGGDYSYLHTFQKFGFNQFGSYSFAISGTANVPALLQLMSVAPGQNRFDSPNVRYNQQIGNLLADYHMHQIAFYAQDSWRVNSRLQIQYGLRWEGQANPDPVATNTAVVSAIQAVRFPGASTFDPSQLHDNMKQVMPRFGFTLRPFHGDKTVIRGHAGLFYAASPMVIYGGTTNNFRNPPGDVSFFIPGGANQPTVYQIFKQAGIDLNTFTLDKLPTPDVSKLIAAYGTLTGTTPDPFLGANFTGTANDFQNPRAFQAGLGVEHQIANNWTVGVQGNYINTVHLERNRDYNLPAPTLRAADGRYVFTRNNRPLPQYGQLTLRESSARSMYRGVTFSTSHNSKRLTWGLQYTLSDTHSDDDNERDAGGFTYDNPFNLRNEYGYSNLDIRHNFSTYAVVHMPFKIDLAPVFRYNSGKPIDPGAGADNNGDSSSTDRAYQAVGVPFERNSFRNRGFKTIDLRFIKTFQLGDRAKLQFSTEMFNLANFANVVYAGGNLTYGSGISTAGATVAPNAAFMRLRTADGKYDATNVQLGNPFQAQFGLRLIF